MKRMLTTCMEKKKGLELSNKSDVNDLHTHIRSKAE
jgi:hypothetical protein